MVVKDFRNSTSGSSSSSLATYSCQVFFIICVHQPSTIQTVTFSFSHQISPENVDVASSFTHHILCQTHVRGRWKITCDGSPTIAFRSRTHFFKANPLFRISAINSEGCIDGPVSTNHSFRAPLMSGHRQPLSPQWGFQGRLC